MAKYRTTEIFPWTSLGTSGTEIIDIRVKDPITALRFYCRFTATTGERIAPDLDVMSKIEIVDGSDVLFSLSGTELAAHHFYEGGNFLYITAGNLLNDGARFALQINFGRFFRDPLLALDPSRHRNPQLRVTWNVATPQALGSAFQMQVIAEVFDEKIISPIGFLRTTEFKSYSPGATSYEYTDLPTDLVIRKLYLQTKEFGTAATQQLTDIKLSEDNDKKIPFDMDDESWAHLCAMLYGSIMQNFWAQTRGVTGNVYGAPCKYETVAGINTTDYIGGRIVGMTGGLFTFACDVTTDIMNGIFSGFLPYFVWCYPFGDEKDPEDWYDPSGVGSLRLRVQSGSASSGATFNIMLQQLRRY